MQAFINIACGVSPPPSIPSAKNSPHCPVFSSTNKYYFRRPIYRATNHTITQAYILNCSRKFIEKTATFFELFPAYHLMRKFRDETLNVTMNSNYNNFRKNSSLQATTGILHSLSDPGAQVSTYKAVISSI